MNSIRQVEVSGIKVIVRADFDVPVEDGNIQDKTRIEKSIPTLKLLLERGASVFIISHLGRPQGRDHQYSLRVVQPILEELLDQKVIFQEDIETKKEGKVILLENLRFWPQEEANDHDFAKKLSGFGQIYVNECFSSAHRNHASVVRLPSLLPGYFGLELEKEVGELEKILKNPQRPLVAIIGGAKLETKLPAITNLAKVADEVLVGGRLMFEINKDSLAENVVVASDHIDGKDIGVETLKLFQRKIAPARMIVWNGPMGRYEEKKYRTGTLKLAEMVAEAQAYKIVGGGDTIAALDQLKLLDKMDFVSVGGGAMLDFLSGKRLPALEALGYYE